nr:G-type lectin S-receptor-like serine/threonine-protein kinase SD3-1 isoform X1 [Ipomoea batatas]
MVSGVETAAVCDMRHGFIGCYGGRSLAAAEIFKNSPDLLLCPSSTSFKLRRRRGIEEGGPVACPACGGVTGGRGGAIGKSEHIPQAADAPTEQHLRRVLLRSLLLPEIDRRPTWACDGAASERSCGCLYPVYERTRTDLHRTNSASTYRGRQSGTTTLILCSGLVLNFLKYPSRISRTKNWVSKNGIFAFGFLEKYVGDDVDGFAFGFLWTIWYLQPVSIIIIVFFIKLNRLTVQFSPQTFQLQSIPGAIGKSEHIPQAAPDAPTKPNTSDASCYGSLLLPEIDRRTDLGLRRVSLFRSRSCGLPLSRVYERTKDLYSSSNKPQLPTYREGCQSGKNDSDPYCFRSYALA